MAGDPYGYVHYRNATGSDDSGWRHRMFAWMLRLAWNRDYSDNKHIGWLRSLNNMDEESIKKRF